MPEWTDAEIETLLAEQVMGWTREDLAGGWAYLTEPLQAHWQKVPDEALVMWANDWHPLTDIEQAMMLVERLAGTYRITFILRRFTGRFWDACFAGFPVIAEAATPARAICLAALKTLEVNS